MIFLPLARMNVADDLQIKGEIICDASAYLQYGR